MRVFVTGSYVDLDFQTRVPIKLGQKYANESVARAVAMAVARLIGVKQVVVATQGVTTVVPVKAIKTTRKPRKKG